VSFKKKKEQSGWKDGNSQVHSNLCQCGALGQPWTSPHEHLRHAVNTHLEVVSIKQITSECCRVNHTL